MSFKQLDLRQLTDSQPWMAFSMRLEVSMKLCVSDKIILDTL